MSYVMQENYQSSNQPSRIFVNTNGQPLTKGTEKGEGMIYCGLRFTGENSCYGTCDGICGPTNGCMCFECDTILTFAQYLSGQMKCETCHQTLIKLPKYFLAAHNEGYRTAYICNICNQRISDSYMPCFHCFQCNYDVCPKCATNKLNNYQYPLTFQKYMPTFGTGNASTRLVCGERFVNPRACPCGKCDGICKSENNCSCPMCNTILDFNLFKAGLLKCKKCNIGQLFKYKIKYLKKLRNYHGMVCDICRKSCKEDEDCFHCFKCKYDVCMRCLIQQFNNRPLILPPIPYFPGTQPGQYNPTPIYGGQGQPYNPMQYGGQFNPQQGQYGMPGSNYNPMQYGGQYGMPGNPQQMSQYGMPPNPQQQSQYGMPGNPQQMSQYGMPGNPQQQSQYGMPGNPQQQSQYGMPQNPQQQGQYGMPQNPQQQGQYGMPGNPQQQGMPQNPQQQGQYGMPGNPQQQGMPQNPQQQGQYGMPPNPQQQGQYGMPPNPQQQGQYGMPPNPQQQGQYGMPPNPQQGNPQQGPMNPQLSQNMNPNMPPVGNCPPNASGQQFVPTNNQGQTMSVANNNQNNNTEEYSNILTLDEQLKNK